MTTITIPRDEYTQRADDEGRDFYALRTVRYAADQWQAADRTMRAWTDHASDDAPTLVFTAAHPDGPSIDIVSPDEEMGDLYPAELLPFTIEPARAVAGEWVNTDAGAPNPRRIIEVRDDGAWRIEVDGRPGLVPLRDQALWVVVPAPTVTYTVTVRADHTAADVRDMLSNLGGNVTVTP